MFSKLFSRKTNVEKELNERVKNLENQLQERELELRKLQLREKIGKVQILNEEKKPEIQVEVQQFNPKQIEIFEKNLRDLKNENQILKGKIDELRKATENNLLSLEKHRYRVSLDKLYSGVKFNDILESFHRLEIYFIDQLEEESFQSLDKNSKNYLEARKIYSDLKEGKISFEIKTLALKGEKISKLFSKNRKFYTQLNENYLEFMEDISNFDFNQLLKDGFKEEQVEELLEKKNQYEKKFKIR